MRALVLHEHHVGLGAQFIELNGFEAPEHYGDPLAEYLALRESVGVLDLSFRSRICLTGADRARFLHGQVTNDVNALQPGQGCYAALITAKGRMQSDLNIFRLSDELLLDFEPGLQETVSTRLEQYIIADDVQIVDVAPHYGHLSVQGPRAVEIVQGLGLAEKTPEQAFSFAKISEPSVGEGYLMNQPRLGTRGFDLFVPAAALGAVAATLVTAAKAAGGHVCGWQAFEMARIEAGIPRFGVDMDETNIPLEAGLENRAISFNKGCYIGQEVISRIRTYSQVAKVLRGLRLADNLKCLPEKGVKLFHAGKEAGYVTSAIFSPTLKTNIALGYVRKEVNAIGTELMLRTEAEESRAQIVPLPFQII